MPTLTRLPQSFAKWQHRAIEGLVIDVVMERHTDNVLRPLVIRGKVSYKMLDGSLAHGVMSLKALLRFYTLIGE